MASCSTLGLALDWSTQLVRRRVVADAVRVVDAVLLEVGLLSLPELSVNSMQYHEPVKLNN